MNSGVPRIAGLMAVFDYTEVAFTGANPIPNKTYRPSQRSWYGFTMKVSLWIGLALVVLVSNGCASRKKEVRVVELGAKAEIGPFVYQAFDTHWPLELGDRIPKERFFTIHLSALNSGTMETTVPSLELVDDDGNSYPESTDGTGLDNWMGLARKVGPGQTEQGTILFDVPPKHYRLRVADENDNFMYIDVPFNLSTEEPVEKKALEGTPLPQRHD